MAPEKTCTDPECRSDEAHRKLYSLGRCRNCYMRLYRSRKRSKADATESALKIAQAAFEGYMNRNRPVLRLRAVQRLVDQGKTAEEVLVTFYKTPELLQLVVGLGDPIKALKRDLAAVEAGEQQKTASQRMLERQIRQTREKLELERFPARDKAHLYVHLHQLEHELALTSTLDSKDPAIDEDREAQLEAAFKARCPPPDWYIDNGKSVRYYDRVEGLWTFRLPTVI